MIVELTIIQRFIFTVFLILMYYWGFYVSLEHKYKLILGALILYIAVITIIFNSLPLLIALYKQNWPSVIFLPILIIAFLYFKNIKLNI